MLLDGVDVDTATDDLGVLLGSVDGTGALAEDVAGRDPITARAAAGAAQRRREPAAGHARALQRPPAAGAPARVPRRRPRRGGTRAAPGRRARRQPGGRVRARPLPRRPGPAGRGAGDAPTGGGSGRGGLDRGAGTVGPPRPRVGRPQRPVPVRVGAQAQGLLRPAQRLAPAGPRPAGVGEDRPVHAAAGVRRRRRGRHRSRRPPAGPGEPGRRGDHQPVAVRGRGARGPVRPARVATTRRRAGDAARLGRRACRAVRGGGGRPRPRADRARPHLRGPHRAAGPLAQPRRAGRRGRPDVDRARARRSRPGGRHGPGGRPPAGAAARPARHRPGRRGAGGLVRRPVRATGRGQHRGRSPGVHDPAVGGRRPRGGACGTGGVGWARPRRTTTGRRSWSCPTTSSGCAAPSPSTARR